MSLEYSCNNCCTSSVLWKTGCLNECKLYQRHLRQLTHYLEKYSELPKYEFRDIIEFRHP